MKRSFVSFVIVWAALLGISVSVAFCDTLMMATTTSTDNTGLLDELAPVFKKDTGIELKWTAVGTGKALKMGENCDVDILFVHAPASEKAFVDAGYGVGRKEVMYNDFVIIGPELDPAGIRGKGVTEALKILAGSETVFVSRGDNSGTNKKEIALWNATGLPLPDKEGWYVQTGQGMIKTILIAEERSGYTLTDRGTYIKYQSNKGDSPALQVLVEGDKSLANQYSVIVVNPKHCPSVRHETAERFVEWITSSRTQQVIGDFRLLGKPLFTPNAD